MQHWTELRTALVLARLGTVSAAAEALGVHRATVNRHVDTLEAEFQAPLFSRHARGYTLTDTGKEMLEIVGRADEMFTDLSGRSRGRAGQLSGDLVVTALAGVAPLVMPAIRSFRRAHPQIEIEFAAGASLARLEYGEAHVAFRAGTKPDTPDYVVKLFREVRFGLYASRDFIAHSGPVTPDRFSSRTFIGAREGVTRLPYHNWLGRAVEADEFALFTSDQQAVNSAVLEGIGVGFLAEHDAVDKPELVEILPPTQERAASIWVVTHMDLHRTEKVQAFLKCI